MTNLKKKEFYDVITGDNVDTGYYGTDAATFRKADNIELVFDSRGSYLGIRTSRGKFVDDKYIATKGPYDFKSFMDLKIWAGKRCNNVDFIETKDGTFMQVDMKNR